MGEIHDIFLIWDHGREELDRFITHLNESHDSIKFTHEISNKGVAFLDTEVKIIGNELVTDLHNKSTDAHNYLHYHSAHPLHCKKGIPYGQFLRIRRICTNTDDFIRQSLIKAAHFKCRAYPPKLIAEGLVRALRQERPDPALYGENPSDKKDDPMAICVTTFHPSFNNVQKILKKN